MATGQARQSSQGRANKYFDVGVVGRKTGLRVKLNVKKDMDGFDSIEDFWDSGGDENGEDTSRPSYRKNRREHFAQHRLQETNDPSPATNESCLSLDPSTLPSPFLHRPLNYRRYTTAVPQLRMSTGPTVSTSWGDASIERARFNKERPISSMSREMERLAPNSHMQTTIDPELLGLLADYGRLKNQGNIPTQQRGFQSSDTSAMTRLSHLPTANVSRNSHPRNATAHQSGLSDMFTRLQHTTSSRIRDYTISALHNSDFYPLDTPSRPSHSVVPHSMWTSSAAGQKRYDTPGVQGSRNIPNYLESLAFPSNDEIMNPPMYYFPDEDDALAGNNSIGQLGIEYDEAVVAEMMAERRKAVGSEGIKSAVTITSVSSCQPSCHSSPRIKKLKAQSQNLHTSSRINRLEGSSCHSSPRSLASQTARLQPTPNADHSGTVEIGGFNKQNESSNPAATCKVPTSCFDTVPMDHAPKGEGPITMLVMDKVTDSNQYADVDHSMDSAAALNKLNAKANDKTKSTPKLNVESAGISSKQSTAVAVDSIAQKKSKEPNGTFSEPAPPTTQPRPSRVPPRRVVTEIPRAAHPCDDASVRRSRRTRLPPLDYWRNERAVYEQSKTTPNAGRVIKGVIRPAEEPSEEVEMPPRKKLRTGKNRTDPQSKSYQCNTKDTQDAIDSCDADDEHESISQSGFEEEPRIEGQVVDPVTGTVIVRAIAESKDTMSRFKAIPESGYKHHMGLAFGGLSSGVIKIEPDREKPNRLAHAGTVIFYVIKGRVMATINNSTFVVTAGGQFMVPRGNQYSIKNVSREDSIIFYARVKAHDAEPVTVPGKHKDGKKKGNTESSVKETKPGNKKLLPPPSPEPSPEDSSQSSPEPVAIDTKNSRSTKEVC